MGDYNLNLFTPNVQTEAKNCYLSKIFSYRDGDEEIHVLTVQEQLTTLKTVSAENDSCNVSNRYANNYDHFTYSPELFPNVSVSYKVIDAIERYCDGDYSYYKENISDHLPIVMTLDI